MIARAAASPAKRLVWFVTGVFVLLGALELLERRYSALFAAATHRGLTKAAMFDRHPQVAVLFLGTSRTQDGVSPDLVTRALAHVAPKLDAMPGFNAAFTGSSLGALVSLSPRFEGRKDVRIAVIELSGPQIFNEPAPWDEHVSAPADLEERLAIALQHVAVVRYRKALIGANLGRLPSLFAATSMGGWETKGDEQLAAWLGKREQAATDFEPGRWRPDILTSASQPASRPGAPGTPVATLDAESTQAAEQLAAVAKRYRSHGIVPAFAVPPLAVGESEAPERQSLKALFRDVALRCECEVWDFSIASLPDELFRDPSHLNREGRAHYSQALAHQIARTLAKARPGER